jgi:cytochrome c553
MRMTATRLLTLGALALVFTGVGQKLTARPRIAELGPAKSPVGEAIYLQGIVGSGAPLAATRAGAEPVIGAQAACVNCHRRSGLGSQDVTTSSSFPPITGQFLFHPQTGGAELPYIPSARLKRQPYTDVTLARAIREGVDADGRPMSYLMPRFALDDSDMAALIAHLRSLDHSKVPGVSMSELHFATIIAPDADPVKRQGMMDVIEHFFQDRNGAPRGASGQQMITSGTTDAVRSMFKVNRRWVLHVWELTGPESTWQEQLDKKFAESPVFAVISGIAGKNWAPVADFCERRAVPCLFPNVEQPPADADRSFHSIYFSRGVLLDADLIAAGLLSEPPGGNLKRVRVIYRAGDIGEAAAVSLTAQLRAHDVGVVTRVLPQRAPAKAVAESVREPSGTDAMVLWLRPSDLAALEAAPAPSIPIYFSGVMGGLDEAPLPSRWRDHAHMAYPVDLPDRRRVRLDYPLGWFRIRRIPVVAEQVQADTYLACGLLSETVKHMVDAFIPDYLIERLEDTVEHRVVTGYYPRLTLGPHQRFASKGGYLVHYASTQSPRLVADGDWMTP